jgi:translation initiation factor 3 subunit C
MRYVMITGIIRQLQILKLVSSPLTTRMSRFFRQAGDSDSDSSESEDELMSSEDEAPPKPTTTAKPAMSRFLRTAGSDSSDDSDSDEESDSDSDAAPRRGGDDAEEEESDGEDRPQIRILSAVDKRLKEMEATGKVMENALKINDWMAISNGVYCIDFRWTHARTSSQNSINLSV